MREMTITRALSELKLITKRIESGIHGTKFVFYKKKASDKVDGEYIEDFEKTVKSGYQSITDLIEEFKKIKSAIDQSNAINTVKIGNKEYKVVDAIQRKNNIQFEVDLLEAMESQLSRIEVAVARENQRVDDKLNALLESMVGKDEKGTGDMAETVSSMSKRYRDDNEYEVVDPLNLKEKIAELRNDIDTFLHEVDFALSESNVMNKITID